MVRLRSQGKAAAPISMPEPKRRGRSRASTTTMTPIRSDASESSTRPRGRPPRKSKTSEEPSSSQRRQTRSHTDNQTFEKLGTPRRKRRRTIGESEDQPAKRQHSDDAEGAEEEEQPSQSRDQVEDDDDDESAPPGQDFFKNINKTILPDTEQIHKLPKLRPDDSAEYHSENEGRTGIVVQLAQYDNGDVIEVETEAADDAEAENDDVIEVEAEIEDSQADKGVEIVDEAPVQAEDQEELRTPAEQLASVEQPEPAEQDNPESRPDPSQPEPSQSGKRQKRRQSQKATFGEPDYRVPRAASPVLGSDPPRSQVRRPSKSKQPLLSQAQEKALYEFVGDDEENHQEQQQREKQGQTSTAAAQAARKRGRTQSQATRSPRGRRRGVAENTAAEEQDGSYDDGDSEADEEPSELPPAEDAPGDDVESEDESEPENDASYIEDSLLIELPKENETAVTAKIQGKVVQKLVTIMSSSEWMGKRKWDRDAKLDAASAKRDFKEALKKGSRPLPRSKVILTHVYGLWQLCHKVPRSPRLDEQNKYFREHEAQFNRLITKTGGLIEQYVRTIVQQPGPDHDAPANQINNRRIISKLHRCIIPMLVWLLRDAFLAGCDIPDVMMQQAVNHTGEFTLLTLQLLLRISGWIRRICAALLNWSELNPPKPTGNEEDWKKTKEAWEKKKEAWETLSPAVETAKEEIEKALKRIEELQNEPEKLKKAIENDRVVQREREKKLQQAKDVRARQMQLFIESTQRKSSSRQVSHRPTQETSSSRPASSRRPAQTGSQSHPDAPRLSREEEAQYFEKHGWYYWEDDRLLRTIRSSRRPDYQVLASVCHERSSAEVIERVKYLKDMVRRKYERAGTDPPLWTYGHE
ncbi:hypothetical protein MRS44_005857 [Fusarium solani]|uniref:Uncharacterized protein n=1 Tax=Fusarium solani TaxID=169388 RepID=A0A9P9L8G7_FUSSL|nr:uncharacterized protein B0J15DRAFT_476267 [Fusarium solani]KAH7275951.1 hypothetical protein B0J15DRAFT_476267 [Fusarium solani]KAJ3465199.1 hypothetical protein MRS44_005857 [Fusarium solani]KAJ4226986.1 hypothetical protein NW759_004363 [Fusarium solani]